MTDTIPTEVTAVPDPFGIDGSEYSDRDREMFVLGYEFSEVCLEFRRMQRDPRPSWKNPVDMLVHVANVPRIATTAAAMDFSVRYEGIDADWCRIRS